MHLLLGLCARCGEEALRRGLEAGPHRALQRAHALARLLEGLAQLHGKLIEARLPCVCHARIALATAPREGGALGRGAGRGGRGLSSQAAAGGAAWGGAAG